MCGRHVFEYRVGPRNLKKLAREVRATVGNVSKKQIDATCVFHIANQHGCGYGPAPRQELVREMRRLHF